MNPNEHQVDSGNTAAMLSFAGQMGSAAISAGETRKGRQWASEEAAENRDFQVAMYAKQLDDQIDWRTHQEEYNSPTAQMKRYADAGVNPMYAITGGGANQVMQPSISGGYGSSTPSAGQHRYQISASEAIQLQNQTDISRAQSDLIRTQAAEIKQQMNIRAFEENVIGLMIEFGYEGIVADARAKKAEYESKLAEQNVRNARQAYDVVFEQLRHDKVINAFRESLTEQQRKEYDAIVRSAIANASITEYINETKKFSFAIDKVNDTIGAVAGAIGAVKGPAQITKTTSTSFYGDYDNSKTSTNYITNQR